MTLVAIIAARNDLTRLKCKWKRKGVDCRYNAPEPASNSTFAIVERLQGSSSVRFIHKQCLICEYNSWNWLEDDFELSNYSTLKLAWAMKAKKCSSLAPPRGIFHKTQWAWDGVKSIWLMSIFTSKKFGNFW